MCSKIDEVSDCLNIPIYEELYFSKNTLIIKMTR